MGKRRGIKKKAYYIKDIVKEFSQYSDAPIKTQELMIKAVIESIINIILKAEEGSRIILTNLGTFDIRKIKNAGKRLRNFSTNEIITTEPKGSRVVFVPSVKIKKELKEKDVSL